jgi:transposase
MAASILSNAPLYPARVFSKFSVGALHSSGASVKRGGLTKAGNRAARRLLIEAALTYRFPARVSRELQLRQEEQYISTGHEVDPDFGTGGLVGGLAVPSC